MSVMDIRVALSRPTRWRDRPLGRMLQERRSVREYARQPLERSELGRLLWAAQGISGPQGLRTAPSAGALYPLEIAVAAGDVRGLPSGIYRYHAETTELALVAEGDRRRELGLAALGQECVESGAVVIAIAAVFRRTTDTYGDRGIRYVHMEVGHAAQNIWLEATALDLGTVAVGAFDDTAVKHALHLPPDEEPLCLMPVGRLA